MKTVLALTIATALLSAVAFADDAPPGDHPLTIGEPPLPVRAVPVIDSEATGGAVLFSPDGKLLLTEYDGVAGIWNAKTAKLVGKLIRRGWLVNEIQFVADGGMAFVYSRPAQGSNEHAQYFDTVAATPVGPDFDLGKDVWCAASSADGDRLAAGMDRSGRHGPAGEIEVFDRSTSRIVFSKRLPNTPHKIQLNRDGSFVACQEDFDPHWAARDFAVQLVRLRDGKLLFEDALSNAPDLDHGGVGFSPDGRSVAICDEKGFKVFDLETEKMTFDSPILRDFGSRHEPCYGPVRFEADGASIAVYRRGGIYRWDCKTRQMSSPVLIPSNFDRDSVSRDGARASGRYSVVEDGQEVGRGFAVLDLRTGRFLWQWTRPEGHLGMTALSPAGRHLALTDQVAGAVRVIDLNDLPPSPATQPATAPAAR